MIVLDCSAAINIALNTETGRVMHNALTQQERVVAPAFYQVEVANVAWKYAHSQTLDDNQANLLRSDALALVDDFYSIEPLMDEAFGLSLRADHSIYDLLYLVLARRNNSTLLTADKKLQDLCAAQGVSYFAEINLD